MSTAGSPVLWFIVDGAAAWAVRDLLHAGELPHLRTVVDSGWWRPAVPAQPPCSTPAGLATLLTGTAPARHGVWGRRVPIGPGETIPGFSPAAFTADAVWDSLARAGRSVGLAQIPWACGRALPDLVAAVDGFSDGRALSRPVPGADDRTPVDPATAGPPTARWHTRNMVLSTADRAALGPAVDPRIVNTAVRATRGRIDHARLLGAATTLARSSERAAELAAGLSPDVLVAYQPCVDAVAHHVVTSDIVTGADRHSENWRTLAAAYRLADRHLGRLLSRVGPRHTVIVSSDHGMDAKTVVVRVNRALAEAGLVVRDDEGELDPMASDIYFHPAETGALVLSLSAARESPAFRRRLLHRASAALGELRVDGRPAVTGLHGAGGADPTRAAAWIRAVPGVQLRAGWGIAVVEPARAKGFHQLYTGQRRLRGIFAMGGDARNRPIAPFAAEIDNRWVRGMVERAAGAPAR